MSKKRNPTRRTQPELPSQRARRQPDRWQIVVFEKADETRPALAFLGKEVPETPRKELLKTIVAVAQVGPLRFPTGQKGWHLMHKPKQKGQVDMSGIFEARDKHGDMLYRVYCVIDGNAAEHGISLPSVVLIGGAKKRVGKEVSQAAYREIDAHRKDYWKTRRVAKMDDLPGWWPRAG